VLCIESYVGDPDSRQGVKLEDQFLVHADSVERLSTYPFCAALDGALTA
jgi:Xaa-Pro dipeptidase